MATSLSGIASGVDTDAIVTKLMTAESGRRLRMDWTQAQITARSTGLASVQTKLTALRTALQGMRDFSTWTDVQSVESSTNAITARRTGGAGAGGYQVDVTALARAEQRAYDYTPDAGASTLTIGSSTINLKANAPLADVVSAINGSGSSVYAASSGGKLVLSSRTTGTAGTFTASGGTIVEDVSRLRAGTDAQFSIDGGAPQTSSSNVVKDAITGVELTLKGLTTGATINVGAPGADVDLVTTKIKAFVTAYNDVVTTTQALTSEDRIPTASNATDYAKGSLRADTGLNALLSNLRQAVSNTVAGNAAATDTLKEIGISTGKASSVLSADSQAGLLVLDETKLKEALADPQAVRRLLGGVTGQDGFAQRAETLVGAQLGLRGDLTKRIGEATSATKNLQASMTREDTRLAAVEKRYKAQFAAMEAALQQSQTQQAWLEGQIASLG